MSLSQSLNYKYEIFAIVDFHVCLRQSSFMVNLSSVYISQFKLAYQSYHATYCLTARDSSGVGTSKNPKSWHRKEIINFLNSDRILSKWQKSQRHPGRSRNKCNKIRSQLALVWNPIYNLRKPYHVRTRNRHSVCNTV